MAIRTALVSVTDKSGLAPFARELAARGVQLLSSGGTAKALAAEGVPVQTVEDYTGSPEVMDGRVKTLHPRVHGGILSRGAQDEGDLARLGARPIDLVVVNLYAFEKVAAQPGSTPAQIIENIDIGGPSMVRSAAKNHARVTIVCDPADYPRVLDEIVRLGDTTPETRAELAAKAFAHTAACATARTPIRTAPSTSSATRSRGPSRAPRASAPAARNSASTTWWTSTRRTRPSASSSAPRRWS